MTGWCDVIGVANLKPPSLSTEVRRQAVLPARRHLVDDFGYGPTRCWAGQESSRTSEYGFPAHRG